MPVKRNKMIKIETLDEASIKQVTALAKRYFSRYGSAYVGISKNPELRFKAHNKRLMSGNGNKFNIEPWPLCVVLCEVKYYSLARKYETHIIKIATDKFKSSAWNDRIGSPGRKPRRGSKGYIYLLLDKAVTEFIEVDDKTWREVVKDPKKLKALKAR